MLPTISFKAIPEYIIENEIKSAELFMKNDYIITIYHIIVGSHMFDMDLENTDARYIRNHEFPAIVRNLFTTPTVQFSPELNAYLSNYKNILIRQIIFLIDPMYNEKISLHGFKKVMPELLSKYTFETTVEHNAFKHTKYTNTLEPIIIPSSIDERDIIRITDELLFQLPLNSINSLLFDPTKSKRLVNIIDCTSHTLNGLHINNEISQIYLALPNCLLIDNTIQYMPIITLDNTILGSLSGRLPGRLRWANYNNDYKLIPDLKIVVDYCNSSMNLYNFLINDYKMHVVEIDLLTIYKMMGLFTISKEYILLDGTKFIFKEMKLLTFIELWNTHREFHYILYSSFDPYFRHNITKFINNFIAKYSMPENTVGIMNSFTITDAIKKDVWEILVKLNEYFPDDINRVIPPEHYLEVDRLKIRDYIEFNGVHM